MERNSLMIGDWVRLTLTKKPTTVTAINGNSIGTKAVHPLRYDEIEPIPLTEEILEASGFKYHGGEIGMWGATVSPYYECTGSPQIFCDGDPFAVWFEHECNIRYVHELQHVLRLCGIEKELTIK